MMMRWAVLGVALVGCYAPHVQSGAPCSPDVDNCPGGQMCLPAAGGYFCGGVAAPDASTDGPVRDDAPIDGGANCFGTGLGTNLCLAQAPAGTVAFTAAIWIWVARAGKPS